MGGAGAVGRLTRDVEQVARGWRWTRRALLPRSADPRPTPRRQFPTEWARTPVASAIREVAQRGVLRPLVWSQTRPEVHGLEHLERLRPPVIFVSNHASHLDAPLVLCSLPPDWAARTAVGAAADYFFDARWRALGTSLVFNAFPVDRAAGRRATVTARRLLDERWNLLLFPEGTRSPDGWVQRFRHGSAWLALQAGIPVVPVAVRGSYSAMPRGRSWPVPGRPRVSVRYGHPLRPHTGEETGAFTQRLAAAIAQLWDEDGRTWFQSLLAANGNGAQIGAQNGAQNGAQDGAQTVKAAGPDGPEWLRRWEASRRLPAAGRRGIWNR
jgi:1-acyl-sn-glycerol-3-phosphate acyltransferase